LLRFFGLPKNTVAVRLVEPEAKRSMGLIISDREPLSPLARALFTSVEPIEIEQVLAPPKDFVAAVQ
jgi:hypothetical protein